MKVRLSRVLHFSWLIDGFANYDILEEWDAS